MLFFSLLLGCPGPEGCQLSDVPVAALGVGETAYEEVAIGDEVDLVYGTQGGFHVPLAVDSEGFDIEGLVTATIVGTIDGEEVAHAEPWLTFRCNPESGTQQTWNIPLILDPKVLPADVHGKTMIIEATLADSRPVSVEVAGELLINDPEAP